MVDVGEKEIVASCFLKNTGDMACEEVVHLYIGYEGGRIDRPVRQLRGFTRAALDPGEKTIQIRCPIEKLKYYDPASDDWKLEPVPMIAYICAGTRANIDAFAVPTGADAISLKGFDDAAPDKRE